MTEAEWICKVDIIMKHDYGLARKVWVNGLGKLTHCFYTPAQWCLETAEGMGLEKLDEEYQTGSKEYWKG